MHGARLWDTISPFSVEHIVYQGRVPINKIVTRIYKIATWTSSLKERYGILWKSERAEGFYLVRKVRDNSSESTTLGSEAWVRVI